MPLPDQITSSLIELKPRLSLQTRCPWCNCMDLLEDWIWQGVHFIGIYRCFCCERKFHLTLPTGHAKEFPVAMDENFQPISYPEAANDWLAKPLIASLQQPKPGLYQFEHQVRRKKDRIIIINCLDTCYGHVLYKLFYSQQYLEQEEYGLLYMVPENVVWMVPNLADEVLVMKGRLEEMKAFDPEIDGWMHEMLKDYDKVYLSESQARTYKTRVQRSAFFPSDELAPPDKSIKTITFILREDRFWTSNQLDYLIFLLFRKYPRLQILKKYLVQRQKSLLKQLIQQLKSTGRSWKTVITGLSENQNEYVFFDQTMLFTAHSVRIDQKSLIIYQHSDLVFGVHGSHLIIPSLFAKKVISLVPEFKRSMAGQDVFKSEEEGKILYGNVKINELRQAIQEILSDD